MQFCGDRWDISEWAVVGGVSITFRVLHTFLRDLKRYRRSLHRARGKENVVLTGALWKQKSSYFSVLIAVLKNNLLLTGSCCWNGSCSDERFPQQVERVSGLEAWALALAPALVALIAVGVIPHVHW